MRTRCLLLSWVLLLLPGVLSGASIRLHASAGAFSKTAKLSSAGSLQVYDRVGDAFGSSSLTMFASGSATSVQAGGSGNLEGEPWEFVYGYAYALVEGRAVIKGGTGRGYAVFVLSGGSENGSATFRALGGESGGLLVDWTDPLPFQFGVPFSYSLYVSYSGNPYEQMSNFLIWEDTYVTNERGSPIDSARVERLTSTGTGGQVPEPSAAALSAAGLVFLAALNLTRRRVKP